MIWEPVEFETAMEPYPLLAQAGGELWHRFRELVKRMHTCGLRERLPVHALKRSSLFAADAPARHAVAARTLVVYFEGRLGAVGRAVGMHPAASIAALCHAVLAMWYGV